VTGVSVDIGETYVVVVVVVSVDGVRTSGDGRSTKTRNDPTFFVRISRRLPAALHQPLHGSEEDLGAENNALPAKAPRSPPRRAAEERAAGHGKKKFFLYERNNNHAGETYVTFC